MANAAPKAGMGEETLGTRLSPLRWWSGRGRSAGRTPAPADDWLDPADARSSAGKARFQLAPGGGAALIVTAMAVGAAGYMHAPLEPPWAVTAALSIPTAMLALAVFLRAQRTGLRVVALAAIFCCLGAAAAQMRTRSLSPRFFDAPVIATVTGWVERIDPSSRSDRPDLRRYVLRVSAISAMDAPAQPHRVRVTGPVGAAALGDAVAVRARLQTPPGAPSPGAYDPRRRFYFDRISASGRALGGFTLMDLGPQPPPAAFARGVARARGVVAQRVSAAAGPRSGPVIAALITGHRGDIAADDAEALRAAGLGHILAISGLHMALVAGGAYGLALALLAVWEGRARRQDVRKAAAIIGLAAATAYLVFSGAAVSTQRAYVMAAAAFIAIMADRRALSLRTLASAAAIVLLWRPESAVSPGFHMSFGAAGALIAAYGVWRDRRRQNAFAPRRPGRVRSFFAGVVVSSVIAGGVTGPIASLHFQRAHWASIPANIALMPIFSVVVMPASAAAGLAAPLGLHGPPARAAGAGLDVMLEASHALRRWAPATGAVRAGPPVTLALVLAGLAAACAFQRGRWPVATPFWTAAALAWTLAPQPAAWIGANGAALVFDRSGAVWADPPFRDDYARSVVLRRAGRAEARSLGREGSAPAQPTQNVRCDARGCVIRSRGALLGRFGDVSPSIALPRDASSLSADCGRADLVLLTSSQADNLRRRAMDCRAPLLGGARVSAAAGDAARDTTVWATPWGLRVDRRRPQRRWSPP